MASDGIRGIVAQATSRHAVVTFARSLFANNWKVVLYVILIIACVLFAPEAPMKFIYTEF